MAILTSEDEESVSKLVLAAKEKEMQGDQLWQHFSIAGESTPFVIALGAQGDGASPDDCLFCRTPHDEVGKLVQLLQDLTEGKRDEVLFEPSEPSFELKIARFRDAGFRVEVWLNAGNAKTGFYRWDAAGVRFFTVKDRLNAFLRALKEEFGC
jgi:hypothetical protein